MNEYGPEPSVSLSRYVALSILLHEQSVRMSVSEDKIIQCFRKAVKAGDAGIAIQTATEIATDSPGRFLSLIVSRLAAYPSA